MWLALLTWGVAVGLRQVALALLTWGVAVGATPGCACAPHLGGCVSGVGGTFGKGALGGERRLHPPGCGAAPPGYGGAAPPGYGGAAPPGYGGAAPPGYGGAAPPGYGGAAPPGY